MLKTKRAKHIQGQRRRRDHQISISPHPAAVAWLGGKSAFWIAQAAECWAVVLTEAGRDVAQEFSASEWELLAHGLADRQFDPAIRQPGPLIAEAVLSGLATKAASQLAEKCQALDYARAWAVIWAVQWYVAEGKPSGRWWDPMWRHENAHKGGT